jgi:two-component system cell cycle sensor histidine kinase/response regulator CckA
VAIESHPGAGTTVTAFFPKAALSLAAGAGEAHSHEVRGGGETILIAEDEAPVRELMAKTLRRLGYRVLVADGATRALQIEATCGEPIHLLVSDVVMPGLSGPDLVQRLVRRRPELQVLYVSGFASHFALRLASTSRHTAFLAKPFGPDLLAQTARALLDRAGHPAANAT